MKRRGFFLSALGVGGALVVGWGLLPPRSRLGARDSLPVRDGEVGLNGWIKIRPDGTVVLAMHRSEMGQGVHTGLAMLVAEELDVPLSRIRLEQAGADKIYGNVAMFVAAVPAHPAGNDPGHESSTVKLARRTVAKLARELGINATGGSTTIADAWDVLRLAAASARARLLGAASLKWRVPVDELRIEDGVISHQLGLSAHFGEFARQAAVLSVSEVALKDRHQWKLIGRSLPRIDVPAKVDGSAVFGIDVRLPGMLFAVMRHCPMLGGAPGRVDVDSALKAPGVERVVRIGSYAGSTAGVAVVGRTSWHAHRAAYAMDIEWQAPPHGVLDSEAIYRSLERTAVQALGRDEGLAFHSRGDVRQAETGAARIFEATYFAPYLAHATMEPINCTAQVVDGKVTVWAATQVPDFARRMAAEVAGVDEEDVTVHVTLLGGGFGRRLEVDAVAQAVRIAMELGGRPVQLVWPREEDFTHDFYRPAAVAAMRAALDARGQPLGLRIASAGDAVTPRWIGRNLPSLAMRFDAPDKTTSEGLFDLPYAIPHQRIAHVATTSGVPIGYWRAVGHSHNAFFSECFVDELAHAAGQDPVAFRLGLLESMPRHAAVLRLAAEQAGWDTSLPLGRARGVALAESFNSIVAQVVEVSCKAASRACTAWCAPSTAARWSTPASSRSRWRAA